MGNEDYALSFKNICKTFPGVKALDDVSMDFKRATVSALMGENGAGKSTLMKILSGAYSRD
ncbi:MAG: ATP-binding cassette domain-containing protein [Synergistaceae bacterium]|nr:ATP-binding cassette domain-containing protein [Synergistaceae bacterium]